MIQGISPTAEDLRLGINADVVTSLVSIVDPSIDKRTVERNFSEFESQIQQVRTKLYG